jgi:hypothetical protein
MKRLPCYLMAFFLLVSCSVSPSILATESTAVISTTHPSSTPRPPTNPPAPTEVPAFTIGLPLTLEECNYLELHYKEDGSIDEEWLAGQLKILSTLEHQWIKENGILDASNFGIFYGSDIEASNEDELEDDLPFPTIQPMVMGAKYNPISCTQFTFAGNSYVMYGFPAHRLQARDDSEVVMIHAVFDRVGRYNQYVRSNSQSYFGPPFDPDTLHENLNGPSFVLWFWIFVGNSIENPELFSDWELSTALISVNDGEEDDTSCSAALIRFSNGEYFSATAAENRPWISRLEQCLYPMQQISSE